MIFVLAVAGAVSYPNFGLFHPGEGPIHHWDAFHYFMGAKYLPELGYSKLYEATYLAGRELGAFRDVTYVRDLQTYAMRDVRTIDGPAVRARFSPLRWQSFRRDLAYFGPRITEWPGPLLDHGYNDPPPRALLLHLLVDRLPATPLTLALLTSLDYLLILLAFAMLAWIFGTVPTALALAFFALNFFARFDFIGGAILRWDWIVAVLIACAALARGAGVTAGLLLAYATLARLFPVIFVLPLAVKWAQQRLRRRPDAALTRCLATCLVTVLIVALGVFAAGEQRSFVAEYISKIRLHNDAPALNAVGLGALMVVGTATWSQFPDGRVYMSEAAAMAARPAPWIVPLAAVLCFLVALPLILRTEALPSMMYGVPLLFVGLSLSGYYYSFLVFLILLPWWHGRADRVSLLGMAVLTFITAASYAFEVASPELLPLYYQASMQVAIFFALWLGFQYARYARPRSPCALTSLRA
jgi:hypothetical protein